MVTQLKAALLITLLSVLPVNLQAAQVEEKPGAFTMMGDLLVARPLGLVLFGIGSVTYVATLPFSMLGGNAREAGRILVVEPGKEVFVRCLGCRRPGRRERVKN